MAVYKRDDLWRYRKRVQLPDGTRIRIAGTPALNTKRAAEEAERAHVERELNPPKPTVERRLMSDVFVRFMADYVALANNKDSERESKRSAIDRYLEPELGALHVDEVTEERIVELQAKLHRTPAARGDGMLGAKTVKNILQTLRKCLRWAKKMKWIADAPEIQMPKIDEAEIRFLEQNELEALLDATTTEPMWFAAVLLGVDAGLRLGELRALQWTDINEVTNKIVIARSRWRNIEGSPKGRKPRSVPMTKRLREALHAIRSTKLRGPYVLSNLDGGAFGAEWMGDTMDRLSRKAKLTECGWHTLRHTFITRLAMAGAPSRSIQELAGHASINTTMRYMHMVKGAADAAIALLDAPERAPRGHEAARDVDDSTEVGAVVHVQFATPTGFEPGRR